MAANASLRWSGLEELREQLRNLPAELTTEATRIVESTANSAAVEIRTAYSAHRRSGNLQEGVIVTHTEGGKWSAGAIVKSTAPHAWLFEYGSQTRSGAGGPELGKGSREGNRAGNRESMPPAHVFGPIAGKWRRLMFDKFLAMLDRNGLKVIGRG